MRKQRFGVGHKESIKNMKKDGGRAHDVGHADSAHAHMSMVGIRDMSLLENASRRRAIQCRPT